MKILPLFRSLTKLDRKITLFIILVLGIFVTIFSVIIFNLLHQNLVEGKMKNTKMDMAVAQSIIQKNVEMCNMSTQVFLGETRLRTFIIDQVEGKEIPTQEKLEFYRTEISNLEKIANSNPYLHYIRIYVNAKDSIEMMPILYNYDRLKRFEWAKDGQYKSGTWQFDYQDKLFLQSSANATQHIVSLVSKISDFSHGEIATIEVATKMELLFPSIYSSSYEDWSCFIDQDRKCYFNNEVSGKWEDEVIPLLQNIREEQKESYYQTTKIDDEEIIVACEYIKTLDGYLMKIVSLKNDNESITRTRNSFILFLFLVIIVVTILIEYSIRVLLKRLYEIIRTVHLIGQGNLHIRIPVTGDDEVGDLAKQINLMLEHMTELMEQGIQKERLIKDTEIKALQNQINAHFIYNVLESIKMMAEIKKQYVISDALTSLGKLLRYTMRWGEQCVTIEEEIEYIKNYLVLINLRFDYRIILSINMKEDLLKQRIPKMSLQPIIENAIYHGIEELAEDTTIYIKGIRQENNCSIEIIDSGVGMTEEQVEKLLKTISGEVVDKENKCKGNGLGLKNVQDRMIMSFGKEYGISIASKEGCYTKVIAKIPYVTCRGEMVCKD